MFLNMLNVCVFVLRDHEFQSRYRYIPEHSQKDPFAEAVRWSPLLSRGRTSDIRKTKQCWLQLVGLVSDQCKCHLFAGKNIVGVPAKSLIIRCRSYVRKPPLAHTGIFQVIVQIHI